MLDPEHEVVVTGEEHHQAALAPWAPRADGRPRRVAVALDLVPGTRGRRVIEVRLEGRRVGVLTALMSERYAPHLQEVLRRRERPGCVAMVVRGRRGLVEMQLFLPEVVAGGTAALPPVPPAPPAPRPAPGGWPGNAGPGGWPGPDTTGPGRGRRRSRRPLWVGAGVLTALVVIGSSIGGSRDGEVPTVAAAAPSTTTQSAAPTTTRATTPAPTTAPVVVEEADAPVVRPAEVTRAPQTRAPAPAPRTTTRAPEPVRPAPEPVRPAPEPEPEPQGGGCDPNYSGCVPIASDVDCAGGSGNGPAYVSGPVRVTGSDIYGLDADDDGVGCE
ncbi:hypothetical protein ACFFTK_30755 [Pseudonocardia petroleophila]|uniref:Excalibur calcium-binding domain-containing protein n=1 Tax=Pseudonocardia petroleophila TaxID=37331 RepID=A0A7G7MT92_9PSEU|nr:hypothetical protein [Pseudonocardia petroleophila]QNG56003.1 hypothetical protein H6H00_04120 [Pseudonocardia petroleophila]